MRRGRRVLFLKEFRVLHTDGSVRWVRARGRSHFDDDGQTSGFGGLILDITEQKRVEEQLRINSNGWRGRNLPNTSMGSAPSCRRQCCRLLGLQPSRNLPVHTVNAVVHGDDAPIIDGAINRKPGASSEIEFRVIRRDNGQLKVVKEAR